MHLQNNLHLPSTRQRTDGLHENQSETHASMIFPTTNQRPSSTAPAHRVLKTAALAVAFTAALSCQAFVATSAEAQAAKAATTNTDNPIGSWGYTTGSATYIRIRPSAGTPNVDKVLKGTKVMVWGTYSGWYRVETTDNKFGWIHKSLVNVTSPEKLQELSHERAKLASDRTGDQVMYGDAEQLQKYYAEHKAPGAKAALVKMGIDPDSAVKTVSTPNRPATLSSRRQTTPVRPKAPEVAPMPPSDMPQITAADIMAARAEYLKNRNQLASRHKSRPSSANSTIKTAPAANQVVPVKPTSATIGESEILGTVQVIALAKKAPSRGGSPRDAAAYAAKQNKLGKGMAQQALSYRGRPYIRGASNPSRGFDCSGLVSYILRSKGFNPPRTAAGLASWGKSVPRNQLKEGDVVLFANTYKRGVSHCGIYIGNHNFVHAANRRSGVKTDSLGSAYWKKKYYGARRAP